MKKGNSRLRLLGKPRHKLGLRALPNLITVTAMLCGFASILRAVAGDFSGAGFFILIAALLDGIDGKIARMTGAESEIGQQFDSLSDMVAFGVAPVMLLYTWASPQATAPALFCGGIYLSCVGFRLARFNLGGQEKEGPFYRGVPTPAAACTLSGMIWLERATTTTPVPSWLMLAGAFALALVLAGLMVSKSKYYKFQQVRSGQSQSAHFLTLVMIGGIFSLLIYDPPLATFGLGVCYTLSGPIRAVYTRLRHLTLAFALKTSKRRSRSDDKVAGVAEAQKR